MGRILLMLLLFYFNVDKSSSSLSYSSNSLDLTPLCLPEESSALLHFKTTLSIDSSVPYHCQSTPLPKINSWNETTNCCLWDGITCDNVTAHVIALDLSCSWLVGSLPANTTVCLPRRLQRLNLSLNNLNGPIPSTIFTHLVRLTHLDLSTNGFSGLIPSEISLLSHLVSLDLSWNSHLTLDEHSFYMLARNLSKLTNLNFNYVNMSCVPPSSLLNLTSNTLKCLSLSSCALNGELPIDVFRFPYLQYLDLSWNLNLAGYLPRSNWSSPLELLDISSCNFRGQLPPSLGNLTQLSFLDLVPNSFGGEIPDVFGSLKKLAGTLDFNSFNGQLPPSIFNLTQVTSLVLTGNLEGEFPTHVSGLQNLEDLYLSDTLISGAIPPWLFALPCLKSLKLPNNKFLSLPTDDQIQNPSSIQVIDLGLNHIHGSIPSFLFHHLVNLTQLDLSSNNLNGVITSEMLAKAKNLQMLDVSSNNQLSLSRSHDHVNYTFDALHTVEFSSCNITRFPSFFRTAKNLTYLSLSNNKIQGSISKWESEGWEQLIYLYLSENSLSSIEQYPGQNLQELDVSSNQLHGPLLTPPPPMMKFLMSNNNLTGEIPTSFCNLNSLLYLDLSRNKLGGIIPPCLATTGLSGYIDINLQFNNFHGNIPAFGSGSIQTLALNDNQFEGLLPRSLVNCTALIFLNVANNKLNDTFPHWLGILPQLQLLVLKSNAFHGPLENATAPSSFLSLEIIDLSGNAFSGTLPTNLLNLTAMKHERGPCVGQCFKYLYPYQSYVEIVIKRLEIKLKVGDKTSGFTILDFSDNQFHGGIPKVLGELGSLLVLNLSHNNLNGSIPPTLGHMAALESLDLSSNKLGGEIPPELTNLIFLEVLNLSHNNLIGLIPQGKQFNTFDNDSYIGNLGLWGCPLSKECHNIFKKQPDQPNFVDQHHEDGDGDDESGIPFIWKVAAMGYGCGIVLGLSIGYIMFTTGRPWWIVGKIERYLQQRVTKIQGRRRRN